MRWRSAAHGRTVIISGGIDHTVRVWDLETDKPVLGPLTGHYERVNAVAAGERHGRPVIISVGHDKTVRVWDLETNKSALGRFTGHDDPVNAWRPACHAAARSSSPAASTARSGCGTLKLASRHSARSPVTLARYTRWRPVNGAADRSSSPVVTMKTARVWDLDCGERVLGLLTGHDGLARAIAIAVRDAAARRSSGGSFERTRRVWDLYTGELVLGPLTGDGGTVTAVTVGERMADRSSSPVAMTRRCGCGT